MISFTYRQLLTLILIWIIGAFIGNLLYWGLSGHYDPSGISFAVVYGAFAIGWVLRRERQSKRKRKIQAASEYEIWKVKYHERDEVYWQDRVRAAHTGVVDAEREYRDTLQDYAKWRGDKAIEEAHQARDAELEAAMKAYRIEADGDNLIPIERENKLLAYLRQLTDEDSN